MDLFIDLLRVVQMGVHFTFEFNLGDRRRRADPTRKLGDVIFNRFSIDLDMSHHEVSITSQRIEVRNSWFELPSGLPLRILKRGASSRWSFDQNFAWYFIGGNSDLQRVF